MGEVPHACAPRAIQTVACLSRAWREEAAERGLACMIAQGNAPAWTYALLPWDRRRRVYTSRNQRSTYEMLVRLEEHYHRLRHVPLQGITSRLDAELRQEAAQRECGRYAGLNQWSHCCTAAQLRGLARRAHAAYAGK